MKTTGKVCIPFGAQKEAELKLLNQILNNVEKHQIPPNLIINFDQTLSKNVPVSSTTMDKKGGSNVPIEGISDKRSTTATFSVTLDNKFLPMQLIYKCKTGQSLPKIKLLNGFSLSANESHYSNENEALKFVEEIILPYIRGEREKLGSVDQKALLIFDVFRGQTTDKVLKVLEDNNILATKIPPKMTHLFQPLDLTVNKVAKGFMKRFSEWFKRPISIGLENGQELEDIQIDYCLSVLKPMHAKWLLSFYDFMSSPEGKVVIASGWRKSGILVAVEMGLSKLPVLDPFNDICPLVDASLPKDTLYLASFFPQELESYRTKITYEIGDDESEREVDDEAEDTRTDDGNDENDDRNAFDIYGDE